MTTYVKHEGRYISREAYDCIQAMNLSDRLKALDEKAQVKKKRRSKKTETDPNIPPPQIIDGEYIK